MEGNASQTLLDKRYAKCNSLNNHGMKQISSCLMVLSTRPRQLEPETEVSAHTTSDLRLRQMRH